MNQPKLADARGELGTGVEALLDPAPRNVSPLLSHHGDVVERPAVR
jgi:hypothetical protein